MKEIASLIEYEGKSYPIVFDLNVMEAIQEEYGTIDKWGELTDGASGEVNIKALIFGVREMMNEGIDINNEKNGTNEPMLTAKQVGRILTGYGIDKAALDVNGLVVDSTKTEDAKNL